jgi:hypothetical protein
MGSRQGGSVCVRVCERTAMLSCRNVADLFQWIDSVYENGSTGMGDVMDGVRGCRSRVGLEQELEPGLEQTMC